MPSKICQNSEFRFENSLKYVFHKKILSEHNVEGKRKERGGGAGRTLCMSRLQDPVSTSVHFENKQLYHKNFFETCRQKGDWCLKRSLPDFKAY